MYRINFTISTDKFTEGIMVVNDFHTNISLDILLRMLLTFPPHYIYTLNVYKSNVLEGTLTKDKYESKFKLTFKK